MIFQYLYADMSLKRFVIISILSVSTLVTHASAINDTIAAADTIWFEGGSWYAGQIADSLFNGYGKMVYADSTIYEGEWKDGLWEGKGKLLFPDGDIYEGEFLEHEFNGYGVYTYNNGAQYRGYWQNGMFNGAGTMEYADGSVYTGVWKDDLKNGLGILFDNSNKTLIKGEFYNDGFIGSPETDYQVDETDQEADYYDYYPIRIRPDSCWHYSGDSDFYVTFGIGRMMTIHSDFYASNHFFFGFALGFNIINHGEGKESMIYDDETSERIYLVLWDDYLQEIMTEHTFTMLKIEAQFGVSFGRFSLGGALGGGIQKSVRNCRSLEGYNSYYSPGTLYYRTKVKGGKFAYDIYTDYVLKKMHFHTSDIFGTPESISYRINLRAGYSNVDKFYLGLGVSF